MTVAEAVRRILLVHWIVILVFTLAGVGVGYALHVRDQQMYAASTRLTLDTRDTQSAVQSRAIADAARAVATSPSRIAADLDIIHARRDPYDIALNRVTLNPVGTSNVLELTVVDPDPAVATALSNRLAQTVIQVRLDASQRATPAERDQQLADLNTRISRIDADLQAIEAALPTASAPDAATLSGRVDSLYAQRATLVQEKLAYEAADKQLPYPQVVEPAAALPVPSRRPQDMALGLVLGLVAGIAAAAGLETLRPTVASARGVAEVAGAPLLFDLSARRRLSRAERMDRLSAAVRLAMDGAEVRFVELLPVQHDLDLSPLAEQVSRRLAYDQECPVDGVPPAAGVYRVGVNGAGIGRVGLVLVAPSIVRRAVLEAALELVSLTRLPLVGVVTYRRGRLRRSIPLPPAKPAGGARRRPSQTDSAVATAGVDTRSRR
ncbi:MAG TPA: hypothetical protein VOB72_10710 [Candidatus Dormibacteraeota bacterium]|nr:hypothetical protein [Candidatus Dormibacteraeota bacterium]